MPMYGRRTSGSKNGAIGLLIIFDDGDPGASDGQAGPVQRVDELALAALWA